LLGTNAVTCDMVNYARREGAYVIVTDNLPAQKSAGKLIADEAWMISTADIDEIEQLAKDNKVDGVLAGVSEFNLERAMTLCERMGLPFYCTRSQWETCTNKQRFKQLCRNNGVPVVKEYQVDQNNKIEDLMNIKYPVIVKPVDRSSGIGIRICQDQNELLKAYEKAASLSNVKQAIVEEFVEGDEFNAGYTIKDGKFRLTYMTDRYLDLESSEMMPLPQAYILPSRYIYRYTEVLNDIVIKAFSSIGLANGFIFVQGKFNNQGFHLFEANFRFGGSALHRFNTRINGINCMEMLVNYALTGEMGDYGVGLINPRFDKYCCCLLLPSKGGLVGSISGLDEVIHMKNLIAFDKNYDVGDYVEESSTLRQVHLRFLLIDNTIQELKNSICQIQDTVKVLDDKGNNMLLHPLDTNRVEFGS